MCILPIVCGLIVLISLGCLGFMAYRHFKLKDQLIEADKSLTILQSNMQERSVEYSEQMIEFIRKIIMQLAVLQFHAFCDKHPVLGKITEANAKELAESVIHLARESFAVQNIPFENVYFTQTFYDKYIIETSIAAVKDLVSSAVDKLDDDQLIIED